MELFILLFLFLIGSCFGSFTNVVVDRLPQKKSLLHPPSHCDNCHKRIARYDLIPVLSFLILSGKCRYCKHTLSRRMFLVEVLSGLVCLYLLTSFLPVQGFFFFLVFLIILAISLIDLQIGIIPDELLVLLGVLSLVYLLLFFPFSFVTHLITGFISFAFFLLIFLITRERGMGFGDVKYAFFIGFLLSPFSAVAAFYIAFLTGAAISIILVIGKIKKLKGSTIPFGPFLSLGFIVSLLYGEYIVRFCRTFLGI